MTCFFCKGKMTDSTTTHFAELDNCIIIIKNVPCEKCTQCGETVYSGEVAAQIERIVDSVSTVVSDIAVVDYNGKVA